MNLVLGLAVTVAGAASAREVDTVCKAADELMMSPVTLKHVKKARAQGMPVRILVIGSGSTAGAGVSRPDRAYPARLESWLRDEWGQANAVVTISAKAGQTAAQMFPQLGSLLKESRPTLIVWQTGTVDALRSVDLDDFGTALVQGIRLAMAPGTDVILMNPQFGSNVLRLRSIQPYLDYLYQVARAEDAMLFARYAIMQEWVESGRLNLAKTTKAEQDRIADQAHDCVAQLLARMIATHAQ